jgi:hypothetical protein
LTTVTGETIDIILATYSPRVFKKRSKKYYPWFGGDGWVESSIQAVYSRFDTGHMFRPTWRHATRKLEYAVFMKTE